METRERIIEAAGQIFAEKGFHKAALREICARAEANVALVKYHFGDKRGLYRTVLIHALEESRRRYPPDMGVPPDALPEERLRAFVLSRLLRSKCPDRPAWCGRVVHRAMLDPGEMLRELVETSIRPMAERLRGILAEITGLPQDEPDLIRASLSVMGQCMHHQHASQVIAVLYPWLGYGPKDIQILADQITSFSLAGLRALAERRATARTGSLPALPCDAPHCPNAAANPRLSPPPLSRSEQQ